MRLMNEIREQWTARILAVLEQMAAEEGIEAIALPEMLVPGKPPKSEMGDIAYPLFPFAKVLRRPPPLLAKQIAEKLGGADAGVKALGPYLNIRVDRSAVIANLLAKVKAAGDSWGAGSELTGRKVMIEFSSPNTNKPLHLGHLRNDILGVSCSRILAARGAEVQMVNLINDRGVHICKSMLAYEKFGDGETPESRQMKSDHFVGEFYVRYAQWAAEDEGAEKDAQDMLLAWEAGDPRVRKLWETMNGWALDGINVTYKRTGVKFDRIYRESETYLLGKQQIERGLAEGVFYRHEDGSVRLGLEEIDLDMKVFLRPDGTSVYITQDLGTAVSRHEEWPFDQLIYVVGNEQEYHFRVLFFALKKLGFPWASLLRHLAYGMVTLPDGKMKSREGTVVDADELIDSLSALALKEIREKGREGAVGSAEETAEKIAIAALHYYLLQAAPAKDMVFNPKESLSFTGNTGPYLQYVVARVAGLIARSSDEIEKLGGSPSLLTRDDEWELVRRIGEYPDLVGRAAEKLDPSILTAGLYQIARDFSRYYHEVPIAKAENKQLAASRMTLARAVLFTLKSGFRLLNIPYVESM